ncbi:polyamine oxidase [Aspergillus welwitschiae]|uniref:Polyamine oxidase n=1 Tax=Aspergillus welwitschiae TaxID=1341132 RepID=A0A3F3Q9E7_9EURO|nr:polyamine oxidase [Aspergillus welwitschiae]RDH35366.1 polyamine oxidase [Aspergillus welwitschiae]
MRFVSTAALIAAFAVCGDARSCTETDVVILGAGMAGVTAAETLERHSVNDFIVLEYQDRIGGRMFEVTFGKALQYVIEAGANWVHGTGGPETHENPVWTLVRLNRHSLLQHRVLMTTDVENVTIYDQTGEIPSETLFAALEAVSDADAKVLADAGIRLHHNLEDRTYRAALRRQGWNPRKSNQGNLRNLYRGNHQCHCKRGFSTILRNEAGPLFEGQNARRLRTNTVVNEIAQDRFSVTVHSTDGECVRAKYAITTFSLDPVERGYYPLFQPLDLPGVLEGSNILIATVVNEEAYRVEQQSEAETRSEIMEVLRKMFKDKDVPDPVDIYYARWTQEPWSYGSYSNWPPGVSARTHRHLRENVGRVLFAGEATSPQFSGFLHGAYYEGKRAAESIASCLRGPRWDDCDFSK